MKKRDLIAVICPCINSPVSEIIRGISSQAINCNTDVAVFSVFSDTDSEDKNRRCEENIYSLINFDMVSGVIFLEEEFWSERLRGMITELLKEKCTVPVITTGSFSGKNCLTSGIPSYNSDGIYMAVSHLIEKHRCEDIYFLAGPEGNDISEERIKGYMKAMKSHGLQTSGKCVFYGDFWTKSAEKMAERIASGKIKKSILVLN